MNENQVTVGPEIEPWRYVFRNGVAKQLSANGLVALREAIKGDDPRLVQGITLKPIVGGNHARVYSCCFISYAAWQGEGMELCGNVLDFFSRVCDRTNEALMGKKVPSEIRDERFPVKAFLNWYDDTQREVVFADLLPEIELELASRKGPEDEPPPLLADPCLIVEE